MKRHKSRSGRFFAIAALGLLLLNGCANAPSILDPQGPAAARIANLWWLLFWMAMAVLVFVFAFLALALFRRRPAEVDAQRAQQRGIRVIIWAGVVMPAIVLAVVYVATLWTMRALATPVIPEGLTVHVIGQLWWWEVQYPEQQFVTANEIHIPVGQPVRIVLSSPNVIHSFWVPELHGKMDLMPGEINETWIQADRPGVYWGECAEFCGTQHAKMNFLVIAQPAEEYQAWLQQQQQPATTPTDPLAQEGQQIFLSANCLYCHAIRGTDAVGNLGPDLTHLASRRTLGSAIQENTAGNLAGWIVGPQHIKPGNLMPQSDLTSTELQALLAYLATLE
jgi:cytochrome c oxidase subunit 2